MLIVLFVVQTKNKFRYWLICDFYQVPVFLGEMCREFQRKSVKLNVRDKKCQI